MNFDDVIKSRAKKQTWKKEIEYLQRNADIVLGFSIPNNYMPWNNS